MNTLNRAALYEHLSEMVEEIDCLFKEYGYDPKLFDIDELEEFEEDQDLGHIYKHINQLKMAIEM